MEVVFKAWASEVTSADPYVRYNAKLASTACALKRWSALRSSDIKLRSPIVNELIFQLDIVMDSRALSLEEFTFYKHMKIQCLGLVVVKKMHVAPTLALSVAQRR